MANKKQSERPTDADVAAMNEVYRIAEEATELKYKERLTRAENAIEPTRYLDRMAGKVEAMNFVARQSDFFSLILLKEVKESRKYRLLDLTWEGYCESLGFKRRTIDEQLEDLRPFKIEFLAAFRQFSGVDFSKIKYLGNAISGGYAEIAGNSIIYDGEEIPVTPENADDIRAVLERIEESLKTEREERQSEKKTHERRMADEKKHIAKLERELKKYERNAHDKGLSPEEDAFLQRMENLRTTFTGLMLQAEPLRMDALAADGATVRMRAEYIATLANMKMQVLAAYDTACEMYGDPSMLPEQAWQPGKPSGKK